MDWMQGQLSLTIIPWPEAMIRVAMAMVLGLILGLERERKDKPIDFRAYMVVAVTTTIIAMLSQGLYADFASAESVVRVDLSKVIAGVLTGIGFLGAGAIIQQEDGGVIGTATGASIWAAGGIGLAIGFGFYGLGLLAFAAVAIILVGGGLVMGLVRGDPEQGPETAEDDV